MYDDCDEVACVNCDLSSQDHSDLIEKHWTVDAIVFGLGDTGIEYRRAAELATAYGDLSLNKNLKTIEMLESDGTFHPAHGLQMGIIQHTKIPSCFPDAEQKPPTQKAIYICPMYSPSRRVNDFEPLPKQHLLRYLELSHIQSFRASSFGDLNVTADGFPAMTIRPMVASEDLAVARGNSTAVNGLVPVMMGDLLLATARFLGAIIDLATITADLVAATTQMYQSCGIAPAPFQHLAFEKSTRLPHPLLGLHRNKISVNKVENIEFHYLYREIHKSYLNDPTRMILESNTVGYPHLSDPPIRGERGINTLYKSHNA